MMLKGLLRYLLSRLPRQQNTDNSAVINIPFPDGHWDTLQIEPSGLVTLEGWWTGNDPCGLSMPQAELDGRKLPLLHIHRAHRPDVANAIGLSDPFPGLVITWLDTNFAFSDSPHHRIRVTQGAKLLSKHAFKTVFSKPDYSHLLHTDQILGRNNIYGVGPPPAENSKSVVALARKLRGKTLDFGCGSGFLVKTLRAEGVEAYGLEIRRKAIESNMHAEARDFVTLYDGHLPAPFADGAFDSIISTEVLEHIPDPEAAIREIARLCKNTCILTVPDMSAIPRCYYNHVVPWHLLEATHVNFFNQFSLEKALQPYFKQLTFMHLHPETTNNIRWYSSLAVIAEKRG